MRYQAWDAHPGFEFGDVIPHAKIRWHDCAVEVKARLVPRYLWTTASIDVFLNGRCIVQTGGQMRITGSSSAEFDHDGTTHVVELAWGKAWGSQFPYVLTIDNAKVALSDVPVENFRPAMIVWVLCFSRYRSGCSF